MERDAASGGRRALVCQGAEEQGVLASLASVPRGSPVTEMAAVGNRVHISGCFLVAAFLVGRLFQSPLLFSPFLNHIIEISFGVNLAGRDDSLVFHPKVKSWKLNPHKGDLLACCGQYAAQIILHKECA